MCKLNFACVPIILFKVKVGNAQTKIAIKAGANRSTVSDNWYSQNLQSNFIPGNGAAVAFKVPFKEGLHFSPNLSYYRRGYTYTLQSKMPLQFKKTDNYFVVVLPISVDFPSGVNTIVIAWDPHISEASGSTENNTTGRSGNTPG